MEDFRKEWPDMPDGKILAFALECAERVWKHMEYLQSLDPRYRTAVARRIERKDAIKEGAISSKFPMCFVPPPARGPRDISRERVEWLMELRHKPSRLQRLRQSAEKAAEKLRPKPTPLDLDFGEGS